MRRLTMISVAALISIAAIAARTEKRESASSFSDREIFDGVVFGVGPVAQLLPEAREQLRPEIYAHDADELAAMATVRASLLDSIERAQPTLVAEFARVARGGDPAAIRAMLERATEAVNAAADEQWPRLDGTLVANVPLPDRKTRPGPAPRPAPQLQRTEPLFANVPLPDRKTRPGPAPRPAPQLQRTEPLFANVPLPDRKTRPGPAPRPGPQLTSPQLAAQPAWALFSSPLFTDQLAGSIAIELERIEG